MARTIAVANQNGMPGMDHGAAGGMAMADPIQQDTGAPAGAKVLAGSSACVKVFSAGNSPGPDVA